MRAKLVSVDIENFKSFKGQTRIGPLRPFVAVIGPNGSGKSNFMDAISFVMGERTASLRVSNSKELIHGASVGDPVASTASVAATLEVEDGTHRTFTRTVRATSSSFVYRIDDEIVSAQQYLSRLEELGINVKSKNFLVFQGAIENIAMKDSKERTALLEEISGSAALKGDYEISKANMLRAEEEIQLTYMKKKGTIAERKEAKLEKDGAEKYVLLKEEFEDLKIQSYLLKLYATEKEIKKMQKELKAKQRTLIALGSKKEEMGLNLQAKKADLEGLHNELEEKQRNQHVKDTEFSAMNSNFLKSKENAAHLKKKSDSCRKSLDQASKAKHTWNQGVEELERLHQEMEEKENQYSQRALVESQSQSNEINLSPQKLTDYWTLKKQFHEKYSQLTTSLSNKASAQKEQQEVLDSLSKEKGGLDMELKQLHHHFSEATKRAEKLSAELSSQQASMDEQDSFMQDLKSIVDTAKENITEYQRKLDETTEKLQTVRIDRHEIARRKKKEEIVETLRKQFGGVHGRLFDLCKPRHSMYKVAVTKILGRHMDSIVVDTEKTARLCVEYLKENMVYPETFLPVDNMETKPISERLRNIKDPVNVKLLYDVLEFHPKEIKKVVMFCANNSLICETEDDAHRVAYTLEAGKQLDAVALNGTLFKKSGMMSGGTSDLLKKAQRWEDKDVTELQQAKDLCSEKLGEAMKMIQKEHELSSVEQRIVGLRSRMKYTEDDKENVMRKLEQWELEKTKVMEELEELNKRIKEVEEKIDDCNKAIQKLKSKINRAENAHFESFCREIQVDNIRQYEERELRNYQESEQRLAEFKNQKELIRSKLDLEKAQAESVQGNVARWEKALAETHQALEKKEAEKQKYKEDRDKLLEALEFTKNEIRELRGEIIKKGEEIGMAHRDVKAATKELQSAQRDISQLQSDFENEKRNKHNLFKECKISGIRMQFEGGSVDESNESTDGTSIIDSSMSFSSTSQMPSAPGERKLDYSKLPAEYRGLSRDEFASKSDEISKKLKNVLSTLAQQAPNLNAAAKWESVKEKLLETNAEFERVRQTAQAARLEFEKVKSERYTKYMLCYSHVENSVDNIYKALTQNQSAQAIISPENGEEPYLGGTSYNCVAPKKRFQSMNNLSGGERTIAALALLFAIHSFNPAPFFVLDEIDAALDKGNIAKVAEFIRGRTESLHTIVISLKEEFYGKADALIGITPSVEPGDCIESNVFSLDLSQYQV